MKTNTRWIKTDYHVQTFLGILSAFFLFLSLITFLWKKEMAFIPICLLMLMLIPIGVWQIISGLLNTFKGDKLQKIYLSVVVIYFAVTFIYFDTSFPLYNANYFLIPMFIIANIIAVWKYTVVRADFISLRIIDMSKIENDSLLDA
jgi:cellulose synthase/poly-beta-1,6-N-acetylglucosamine synthase-like glycosyltransferase